ncbi:ribosomal-protein-alanine N-acetyltransferase RimI [Bifidobacterium margollesii]|uniref:Ribosomal-protein-alanine N-acetyltransferase RimI n=1 Tax=Bifidobacterium margollesii TaxID=2020964 RepID=A0A2N5J7Z4_9BIFI|nr:ribosomal protein S18-alanine N-acetyltransferase [Bifidobacterium margollesii]PLS30311.1 ribosomal-protein-alanine N-acetyltransferase RimI [Bifidobacterium margollesii]
MIRVFTDSDIMRMAELEADLFGRGAWSESMIRQELEAPARSYFAEAESEGAPMRGYAGFWYDGDDAELMTIGVDRRYQRRGIAAALMSRLIDEARDKGARRMLLEVRVDNEPALALYRSFGFEMMGRRKRYYQPEGIDAFTMSLELSPRVVGFHGSHDTHDTCDAVVEHENREQKHGRGNGGDES